MKSLQPVVFPSAREICGVVDDGARTLSAFLHGLLPLRSTDAHV